MTLARASDRRLGDLAWALLAFALGLAACWLRDPQTLAFTADNQHYYFVAERAASGVPPHVSLFDPKHQLGMLITGAGIRLARSAGLADVAGARAASMLATAGAVALAWLAARAALGSRLAGHLAALVMLGNAGFLTMGAMGARPKTFLALFELAAIWAIARRRAGTAGVALGLAFLCWQPAALLGLAALPVLAAGRDPVRAVARFAIGGLAPLALYHGYFAWHGVLAEQLDQAYRFPAVFMVDAPSSLAYRARAFFRLVAGFSLRSLEPMALVAVLAAGAGVALRHPERLRERAHAHPGTAFALLGGAVTVAFSLYEFQTYIDGFFALPFAAVAVGIGLAWAAERLARATARPVVWRRGLAVVAVAALALRAGLQPPGAVRGLQLQDQQALARELDGLTRDGGSLWAVGCTHLLAFRHRDNHVPYGVFFRGMEGYLADRYGSGRGQDAWRPLVGGRMPDVIVVSTGFSPGGRAWLEREYREVSPSAFRAQGVRVYSRRDDAPDPPMPTPRPGPMRRDEPAG